LKKKSEIDSIFQQFYKGDRIAGYVYILIFLFFISISVPFYLIGDRLGYFYLSIGFFVLALYSLGKGISIWYVSTKRLKYYTYKYKLTEQELKEEKVYTRFRMSKKYKNRKRYLFVILVGIMVSIVGLFTSEKGLIIGTAIPIILFTSIEFCIGLLVEFRLSEYYKRLNKETVP